MGMGHVPQDSPRAEGARAEFQGPQHRRATEQQHLNRSRANQARARFAENLVAAWYQRQGYTIIARNWQCPRGELDVVAWRNRVLVVCEVKARRNQAFGNPFEAVTQGKVMRLRRATAAFLGTSGDGLPPIREIRFDAAAVVGAQVEVRESVV